MSASSPCRWAAAAFFILCASQLCRPAKAEVELSSSPFGVINAPVPEMESKNVEHTSWYGSSSWWNKNRSWWNKNRSGFRKGFWTGLCVAWFLGGSGLVLAVLSGFYTFASHFSWHAQVKAGPMLPLHRLGCA
jgi:hypothetical protein